MINPIAWLWDKLTTDDEERVENARNRVENAILGSGDAVEWLRQSGWSASGGDVSAALRNPATRDAAIFDGIQTFYTANNDPERMLERFTANGLNNGTTTRTYVLQPQGTNHQAVMMVDESTTPPMVTLAFRGVQPGIDWFTPLRGLISAFCGQQAGACNDQAEAFWQGAQGDITRILGEVAQRNPGAAPQIVLAGHSYGADAATRMIPRLATAFPQWRDQLSLVGYGGTATFTQAESAEIYSVLGNDPTRARQYRASNDWMNHVPGGSMVGERRNMACRTGHEYAESSQLEAMMEALETQMARDPRRAEAAAQALVENYRRDPDSVLAQLAAYTNAPPAGDSRFMAAAAPPRVLH